METRFKQLGFILFFFVFGVLAANAQNGQEQQKTHSCTKACTTEMHVYKHGEKGHKCTDACKKPAMTQSKKRKKVG